MISFQNRLWFFLFCCFEIYYDDSLAFIMVFVSKLGIQVCFNFLCYCYLGWAFETKFLALWTNSRLLERVYGSIPKMIFPKPYLWSHRSTQTQFLGTVFFRKIKLQTRISAVFLRDKKKGSATACCNARKKSILKQLIKLKQN